MALREPPTPDGETILSPVRDKFRSTTETWKTVDARERNKSRWREYEHTVGVVDTGDDPIPWIAMEYMDGGDLSELLDEHPVGLSEVEQALWIGECVCKGPEIAHNHGRTHLDVKPPNVLLKETEGWPWPKLADWGLARNLAKQSGTMEGLSLEYAAPEQLDSSKFGDPDQLTDIYQTGALVYTLLTGDPPVTRSQHEVMKQVCEGAISPPSERRPELPATVDATVGMALEREKLNRYDSVIDFRKALTAIRTNWTLPREVADRLEE